MARFEKQPRVRWLGALIALAALYAIVAMSRAPTGTRIVHVRLPAGPPFDASAIRVTPAGHLVSARVDDVGNLTLEVDRSDLTLALPEMCPLVLPAEPRDPTLDVRALIDLGPDLTQIGYDTPFVLRATPGCAEAERADITWQQNEGPALHSEGHGRELHARTLPRGHFFPDELPHGVVAVSPRTQGRYVFEARARFADGREIRRSISVTSIARATGLSSLAVSQRVMLGGDGWVVTRSPRGSNARVEMHAGVATFAPDIAGKYTLRDALGASLDVPALTHDRTPMDCGRAECHAAESQAAVRSPMSHAFELPFSGAPIAAPSCMLDCHVAGERGLRDGGYLDVAASLAFRPVFPLAFADLPHPLQRLAGVRCTSCHGPGAIPSAAGRSRILRASVCATCHDAPPAYTHVDEWKRSRMARADATPSARNTPACARCHTTGGFLDAVGARVRADASHDEDDAVVGISCAACHAPHAAQGGHALLRTMPLPPMLSKADDAPSLTGLCAQCHAPAKDELVPSASSAALWLGRVRLPEGLGGADLAGAAPHANIAGGCVGCHGHVPAVATGTKHTFAVDPQTCATCHTADPAKNALAEKTRVESAALAARARAVLARVNARCATSTDTPLHAQTLVGTCASSDARARYLSALVAEDGAAAQHNAPFARALLDEAEALFGASPAH